MTDTKKDNSLDNAADEVRVAMLHAPYREEERFTTRTVYFICFKVKRGRPAFSQPGAKKDCENLIQQICAQNNWILAWMKVYPDHVRLVLRTWKSDAVDDVVSALKRGTSQELIGRWRDSWGFSLTTLWAVGYFADTQPPNEDAVERYLASEQSSK